MKINPNHKAKPATANHRNHPTDQAIKPTVSQSVSQSAHAVKGTLCVLQRNCQKLKINKQNIIEENGGQRSRAKNEKFCPCRVHMYLCRYNSVCMMKILSKSAQPDEL